MTIALTPYLRFDGNTREAFEFYHSVFGGELDMVTFGEGMPGQVAPEIADRIMHASLFVDRGFHLMASDTFPGMYDVGNGAHSISSDGESVDDAEAQREMWRRLSEGADIQQPLELAPWGDEYGQLVDRFGVVWMVNISANEP